MFQTSIVIPCYFADESFVWMTSTCLASLNNYGRPDQVVVIDDASPLNPEPGHDVDNWVRLPENLGYAGAVNAGLAETKGEVLIISNNDIEFTPGWLEAILDPLERGYDISSIRTTDNGWETEDSLTENAKFGSIWAMKRKVYETLGDLTTEFGRGYFEDLDYRRRALQAGFKIVKNNNHLVEHVGRATFKTLDDVDEIHDKARELYWEKWKHLPKAKLLDDFKGDPLYENRINQR